MSKADKLFKQMCQDILENGTDTSDGNVRPIWTDTNEKAYTIKKFGVVNRYDLREEFPALTLRKTALKSAMDEVLWIYQRKSNNIHDLKPHIWDEWADEEGSIGTCYGYVIGQKDSRNGNVMDQMDFVLNEIKKNPYSRRIITNMFIPQYLDGGHLEPCAYSMTYNVTKDKDGNKVLNAILNQRSQDILAANNWNVCQYSLLLMMVAQVSGMIAGELIHVIADAHIYDRHVEIIKELIKRDEYPAPKVWLNPEIKNFYDFTTDDLHVEDYQAGEQIRNIPIAV
ncbi:MAG: thymidylate synthase [Erysipelotrichaceae bacterium]|jgi:thymidylate synthase|nr:thymidylate synthase [Erysipelotrichaceae bacterium]MBQ1757853.1 thymidylate synthase [Erysipelotrichaceae bacterium]MBQ2684717.1 thymidylate synthase [Erysipelotrichaceae bacterium]